MWWTRGSRMITRTLRIVSSPNWQWTIRARTSFPRQPPQAATELHGLCSSGILQRHRQERSDRYRAVAGVHPGHHPSDASLSGLLPTNANLLPRAGEQRPWQGFISMSFGVLKASLRWQATNPNSRNVCDTIFDWYWSSGIATVASAGNDESSDHAPAYKDLSSNLPRGAGGANTNLIVVGNSQWDTTRYPSSNYRDTGGLGILSLYNLGMGVECGVLGSAWAVGPPGSSQATAITAGMVAYYLHQPELYADWTIGGASNVPWKVKQYLLSTARQYMGSDFGGDSTPRAALGETVPCAGEDQGLSTTQVTDWSEVVISPLVSCLIFYCGIQI
ncbi:hypothetical protein ASPCAL00035 [Aspergillus calidoustus]|nr:hypothetical protein ASPCAL00035 [Aspergillus calidoustus]